MGGKIKFKWLFALSLILVIGCGGDDMPTAFPEIPVVENNAPGAFTLIGVPDGATDVDVTPEFSWEEAIDPDMDDNITYTFYISKDPNPQTAQGIDMAATSYQTPERLELYETYYWQVVAKDFLGATTESDIFSFNIRGLNIPEEAFNENPLFSERAEHFLLTFQNGLWLIGGFNDAAILNDVWHSTDGLTWELRTSHAQFSKRSFCAATVFDDKVWIVGGQDGASYLNDVWYSENGIDWVQATNSAPFNGRRLHAMATFEGKMWIVGGQESDGTLKDDVWYSDNGTDWTQAAASAGFPSTAVATGKYSLLSFSNRLWHITSSGIWSSSDGIDWEERVQNPAFGSSFIDATIVFDNKMWVLERMLDQNIFWVSSDGETWNMVEDFTNLSGLGQYAITVSNDELWIAGGTVSGNFLNGVWVFD